ARSLTLLTYTPLFRADVTAAVSREANDVMMDRSILQNRGHNVLTAEETRFFQAAIEKGGFDDNSILPVTTQERIFDELLKEHPRSEEHTSELQSRENL